MGEMIRVFIVLMLLVTVSCGKSSKNKSTSDGSGATAATPEAVEPKIISEDGEYEVSFTSVNPKVFKVEGAGKITLTESGLTVNMKMTKVPRIRTIYQNIYRGECPDVMDDKNGDGLVDVIEAKDALSLKVLSLDTDLNTENNHLSVYPVSSIFGKYSYERTTTVEKFLANLKAISPQENLDLESSVVLLQGLPTYFFFPSTAQTTGNLSISETLPLACGKILKVHK